MCLQLAAQIQNVIYAYDRLLGMRILHEPRGQNIGGIEPLGPHEVGAYA